MLLGLALTVSVIAWVAAARIERGTIAQREAGGELQSASVLRDGVLYEATPGDPGVVIATDVGSGKELWRAELGSVATKPVLIVEGDRVEVEIAGTPWMILDRQSGEPIE